MPRPEILGKVLSTNYNTDYSIINPNDYVIEIPFESGDPATVQLLLNLYGHDGETVNVLSNGGSASGGKNGDNSYLYQISNVGEQYSIDITYTAPDYITYTTKVMIYVIPKAMKGPGESGQEIALNHIFDENSADGAYVDGRSESNYSSVWQYYNTDSRGEGFESSSDLSLYEKYKLYLDMTQMIQQGGKEYYYAALPIYIPEPSVVSFEVRMHGSGYNGGSNSFLFSSCYSQSGYDLLTIDPNATFMQFLNDDSVVAKLLMSSKNSAGGTEINTSGGNEMNPIDGSGVTSLSDGWNRVVISIQDTSKYHYLWIGWLFTLQEGVENKLELRNVIYQPGNGEIDGLKVNAYNEDYSQYVTFGEVSETPHIGDSLNLQATLQNQPEGVKFYGWVKKHTEGEVENYTFLSSANPYAYTIWDNSEILGVVGKYEARSGGKFYEKLAGQDGALESQTSGDIIIVDNITVDDDITVNKGVSLILPFNDKGDYQDTISQQRALIEEGLEYNKVVNSVLDIAERLKPASARHYDDKTTLIDSNFEKIIGSLGSLKLRGDIRKASARRIIAEFGTWYTAGNKLLNGDLELSEAESALASTGQSGYLHADIIEAINGFKERVDEKAPLTLDELKDAEIILRAAEHILRNYNIETLNGQQVKLSEVSKDAHTIAAKYVNMHKTSSTIRNDYKILYFKARIDKGAATSFSELLRSYCVVFV